MDNLAQYRKAIQSILSHYYMISIDKPNDNSEVSDRLALDEQTDQYLWFQLC